jgi:MYXO-CTERM domain-containing protein
MSMSYACTLCKVGGTGSGGAEGGTGGATGTGGGTGNDAAGNPDAGTSSASKGCGCAFGDSASGASWDATLAVVGLLGLLHARRRRRP